jgi:TonB-linked SusC/RagA family outer membrane protein
MKRLTLIIVYSISIYFTNVLAQQGIVLRGRVLDAENQEPVIGVNIIEYDSDKRMISGTITDPNGNYVLKVQNSDAIILFSFIGYKTQEIPLNSQSTINVELTPESYELEEISIVHATDNDPLTNVSQRDVTSSRVKIDMADSKQIGAISAEETLQGKVTGLDIMSTGDPGSGSQIVIRGLGSFGNSRPLIVVDGIPQSVRMRDDFDLGAADQEEIGDLVNIAPQDIKSIEVLKDAAAAAVWGSKGADGVLLITTYRGIKGRTQFDYQGKYTWNTQPPAVPLLNGNEYIMMQLEEWHNSRGLYEIPPEIAYDRDFVDFYNYSTNTDWVKAVTRNGFINEQYFTVTGGGEKTRYFTSVNFHDNKGTTINTGLKRITTRVNLDYNVSQKLRFSTNFSYSYDIMENNVAVGGINLREMAYMKAPNMSIWEYDTKGNKTGEYFTPINSYQGEGTKYYNPVAIGNLSKNDQKDNMVMNSFQLTYNIFSWLKFQETISFQYSNGKYKSFIPSSAIGAEWLDYNNNQSYDAGTSSSQILTRSQIFLVPHLPEQHSFTGMLMLETEQSSSEWSTLMGRNGPSTKLKDPASGVPIYWIGTGSSETRLIGGLTSLNYKLYDRYLISFNFRTDASSRFGINKRWGMFPSLSLGWRFSEEPWLINSNVLSDALIRMSWGQAGKQPDNAYDRHAIYNTVTPGQYYENPIIVPLQVQLANLQWQTVSSTTIGLELTFLEDVITMTTEIYTKTTKDLLWQDYQIPKSSGFNVLKWYNGGELQNQGWELFVQTRILNKKDLKLNFNFNISKNVNKFLDFPDNFNNEVDISIGNGQYPRRADIGEPIGSFYGFRYLGVWPSDEDVIAKDKNGNILYDPVGDPVPLSYKGTYEFQGGDAIYDDINHDGKIDLLDVVYLGDSNPDYFGGFGSSFFWKNFRASFQFYYRLGFEIVNEVAMNTEGMLDKNNQSKAVLHRWRIQGQNDPGMLPRAYLDHPANNLGSDRYVESGDFLRMINLTFSYSLSKKICQMFHLRSMDIGLAMRRLLTITHYSGQDPEIAQTVNDPFWFGTDAARTPPPKAYTLSIDLGF